MIDDKMTHTVQALRLMRMAINAHRIHQVTACVIEQVLDNFKFGQSGTVEMLDAGGVLSSNYCRLVVSL